MTVPLAPTTGTSVTFRSRRIPRSLRSRGVLLGPIKSGGEGESDPTVGYLDRSTSAASEPVDELRALSWTLEALEVLNPGSFLAAPLSAEAVLLPEFDRKALMVHRADLMPVMERARTGRRLHDLNCAVEKVRKAGLKVAVTGHRVSTAEGFDTLIVDRGSCATTTNGFSTVIATDLRTEADIEWARSIGATLFEGPAVAETIRVAPIEVSRLRR